MPVRRARRSRRFLLVVVLSLLLASGPVACDGSSDDDPPPAATEAAPQTAVPVEQPVPESRVPPVDTTPAAPTPTEADTPVTAAIDGPSPPVADVAVSAMTTLDTGPEADISGSVEPPLPPSIVPAAATATGPAVLLAGPLVVVSEVVGGRWDAEGQATETRRVFLVDRATQRYWPALDYHNEILVKGDVHRPLRLAVQPASRHLIVWGTGQVARVSLAGQIEAVLFEDAAIRAVQVSPDGSHVAILYGRPGTLLVLEGATGVERLRVAHDDPALEPLRTGGPPDQLEMGSWHPDGTALSITETLPGIRNTSPPRSLGSTAACVCCRRTGGGCRPISAMPSASASGWGSPGTWTCGNTGR